MIVPTDERASKEDVSSFVLTQNLPNQPQEKSENFTGIITDEATFKTPPVEVVSDLEQASGINSDDSKTLWERMPKTMKMICRERGVVIHYRHWEFSSLVLALFALLVNAGAWSFAWYYFSTLGHGGESQSVWIGVIALIFFGVIVAIWALYKWFGVVELILAQGLGVWQIKVFMVSRSWVFDISQESSISLFVPENNDKTKESGCIQVKQPQGKVFSFGTMISPTSSLEWVIDVMKEVAIEGKIPREHF